ncbi:SPOR domain-containing protein (plasmid) [Pseudoalteromonas xiamenensis]|uniref:SPOR domain-containing protein n=1 Tax=Pseudoalteromonas xiamenensis TaxID=882626 RepID=UPI0027E45474|nr:SPOR domain-containing protein [Pseudoalteromonas xiamenensis]WMN61923.1 SPOR domain-containing protein [Pseudoalteromonas xiamenensis]
MEIETMKRNEDDAQITQKDLTELLEMKKDLAILVDELNIQKALSDKPYTNAQSLTRPSIGMVIAPDEQQVLAKYQQTISLNVGMFASEARALQQKNMFQQRYSSMFSPFTLNVSSHPENSQFYSIKVSGFSGEVAAIQFCKQLKKMNQSCVLNNSERKINL